jgi:hypothetical protein
LACWPCWSRSWPQAKSLRQTAVHPVPRSPPDPGSPHVAPRGATQPLPASQCASSRGVTTLRGLAWRGVWCSVVGFWCPSKVARSAGRSGTRGGIHTMPSCVQCFSVDAPSGALFRGTAVALHTRPPLRTSCCRPHGAGAGRSVLITPWAVRIVCWRGPCPAGVPAWPLPPTLEYFLSVPDVVRLHCQHWERPCAHCPPVLCGCIAAVLLLIGCTGVAGLWKT